MKTERKILAAFILNLSFSAFEFIGGIFTGSVAIISDAIHDAGDAASIGIAYLLERKSKKQPDEKYTYGYTRYSVIGGFITTLILLSGSVTVIVNAVSRMLKPVEINYKGMIVFAVVGVCMNVCATLLTREGESVNQKAVNLHMLEDVLGWIVVLVGAVVMYFTDFTLIDSIMSVGVSFFILLHAVKNLKEVMNLLLEKIPDNIELSDIKACIMKIDGVCDVHHIHIWSSDGQNNFATMHIVTDSDPYKIKKIIREELCKDSIGHVTIEVEKSSEICREKHCNIEINSNSSHKQHHH
ncbi:MAG: cation transporter [Clostridia bacterium]|nr:cation transporter [Clostridia bacterium]